jgi:hypothetical protein
MNYIVSNYYMSSTIPFLELLSIAERRISNNNKTKANHVIRCEWRDKTSNNKNQNISGKGNSEHENMFCHVQEQKAKHCIWNEANMEKDVREELVEGEGSQITKDQS